MNKLFVVTVLLMVANLNLQASTDKSKANKPEIEKWTTIACFTNTPGFKQHVATNPQLNSSNIPIYDGEHGARLIQVIKKIIPQRNCDTPKK